MAFLDSTAGTSVGPTKRRILLSFMRYRLRSQPARLVRGSSRRIMAMRSQPANIRVINRRASSSAGTGSAIQTGHAPSSPTGTCSRYAARRRLLEVPERCSQARIRFAAPKPGAPLLAARRSGHDIDATGGSDGNTWTPCFKKERPALSCGESRPDIQIELSALFRG
jgi:hypothetical protein